MSFDFCDYLDLAHNLATGPDEAYHRSAISRAYYAAFHRACRYVGSKLPEVRLRKTGEDHFAVWDGLLRSGRRQEKTAGIMGKRLLAARRRADYEADGLSFPRATTDALSDASSVLRALSALDQTT